MPKETKFGYGFLLAGVALPYLIEKFLGAGPAAAVAIVCGIIGIAFLVSGHRHKEGLEAPVESLFGGEIPAPPTAPPTAETGKGLLVTPVADVREQVVLARQLLFQRLADEERKSIGRADWLQLAKDFESCPQQLRAEYSRHGLPGQDSWYIGGWTPSDKCKSLCRMAGTMLISSRQVRYALSEEVRSVSTQYIAGFIS
jgi:hypothetical protein